MAGSRTRLWIGLTFAAAICLTVVIKTSENVAPTDDPVTGILSNSHSEQLREIHGLPSHLGSVAFWHLMSDSFR